MTEIIVNAQRDLSFKNAELNEATKKIIEYGADLKNSLKSIALVLGEVHYKELYKEDGFESAHDYATKTFGFKRAFTYDLLAIGKRFSSAENNFIPESVEFSVSQYKEMLPLSDDEVRDAVENGTIRPEMSAKAIRAVVKEIKPSKEKKARAEKAYVWDLVGTDISITARPSQMDGVFTEDWEWHQQVKNGDDIYVVGVKEGQPIMYHRAEKSKEDNVSEPEATEQTIIDEESTAPTAGKFAKILNEK